MRKYLWIIFLLTAIPVFAGTMEVTTGYGYYVDLDGHVISKFELPIGTHPVEAGVIYGEVDTKEELDAIEIYVPPKTAEEKNEEKISAKMMELRRAEAIEALKADGDLPLDYKDPGAVIEVIE